MVHGSVWSMNCIKANLEVTVVLFLAFASNGFSPAEKLGTTFRTTIQMKKHQRSLSQKRFQQVIAV